MIPHIFLLTALLSIAVLAKRTRRSDVFGQLDRLMPPLRLSEKHQRGMPAYGR